MDLSREHHFRCQSMKDGLSHVHVCVPRLTKPGDAIFPSTSITSASQGIDMSLSFSVMAVTSSSSKLLCHFSGVLMACLRPLLLRSSGRSKAAVLLGLRNQVRYTDLFSSRMKRSCYACINWAEWRCSSYYMPNSGQTWWPFWVSCAYLLHKVGKKMRVTSYFQIIKIAKTKLCKSCKSVRSLRDD